jgi:hypothetical protein
LIRVWHGENPPEGDALRAAKTVADAVLRADLIGLTGTYRRDEVDLLGMVLTLLRPPVALQSRGQFYTPTDVADAMVGILGVPADDVIADEAAGTGGLLRAVAQRMRDAGRDPQQAAWVASDVDGLAISVLAVNVVLWRLGGRVLLGVGDTLLNDFWEKATAQREHTTRLMGDMIAVKQLQRLLTAGPAPSRTRPRAKPTSGTSGRQARRATTPSAPAARP